jgi:glycosyltransferase involved in cell wall biosynthesis
VIDSLFPAGAETLVCQLAESMRTFGVRSEIYALRRAPSRLESECLLQEIAVHHSGLGDVYSPRQIRRLQLHLRQRAYEVIHSHLYPAQLWTAIAATLEGHEIPLVTTEHSTHNRRRRPFWKPLDQWMYRKYDAFVGVSEGVSEALSHWIGSRGHEVRTIHNGINLNRVFAAATTNLKKELNIEGRMLAVSVGRCEPEKNYGCTLSALAQVSNLHLALIGDGSALPHLRSTAERLGLASRVHFLGHRSNVFSLLKGADFFVQASLWEGFCIATIEAAAVGLPVIVSRVKGLADIVGDAGLTFDPANPEELAACMSRLTHDAELRQRMSALSRQRAARFEVEKTSEQYAKLYRSLTT